MLLVTFIQSRNVSSVVITSYYYYSHSHNTQDNHPMSTVAGELGEAMSWGRLMVNVLLLYENIYFATFKCKVENNFNIPIGIQQWSEFHEEICLDAL